MIRVNNFFSTTVRIVRIATLLLMSIGHFTFLAAQAQSDELLPVVEEELKREMTEFGKINLPPYYLAYRIYDIHSAYLTSSFGSLVGSDADHSRILVTDLTYSLERRSSWNAG